MEKLQPVRGTHDLWPEDVWRHRQVVDRARAIAARYGYNEIATPVFEFTEVFSRTLGDTSDVVTKEMYTFAISDGRDGREQRQITLRPEATAGVARAFMSAGLQHSLPVKAFCSGPMFRHERPQKGRQRQFHQIDVELLGAGEPLGDVEVIALGAEVLQSLGVLDRTTLELNTLGDADSRRRYRAALVDYFGAHRDALSVESRDRLTRNPLRILDSKDEGDRRLVAAAPPFDDYLNQSSRDFFALVRGGLEDLGIGYTLNSKLVRGLDYYCHTAFEFTTRDLGAQGTVLGGGRYDGLVEAMGGPPTPAVGWAAGIERLVMLADLEATASRPIAVVPFDAAYQQAALKLTQSLRRDGYTVDLAFSGNGRKRMRRADKLGACAAVLLGEDEMAKNAAKVRDLDSGEETLVALDTLSTHLARYT